MLALPALGQEASRKAQWAQEREEKAQRVEPPHRGFLHRALYSVERGQGQFTIPTLSIYGFQPVLGGLGSGSGRTAGIRYDPTLTRQRLFIAAEALASLRGYWGVRAWCGHEAGRFLAYGFGRYFHRPQEDFYGIGPQTDEADRTDYRRDEALIGGVGGWRPEEQAPFFAGAHASVMLNRVGAGTDDEYPNVRDRFDADAVPGLTDDADYVIVGAFAEYDQRDLLPIRGFGRRFSPASTRLRGLSLDARRGYYLVAEAAYHVDVANNDLDFFRADAEAQQYIPLRRGYQSLAFRQFVTYTWPQGNDAVPFYLLPTLGGSDTIRGFDNFRFHDRGALLINAEYRWQVWHFMDLAAFLDTGQVFRNADEIATDDFATSWGVGARFKLGRQRTVARLEWARSEEDTQLFFSIGSFF
ncbi:MAG: BamA/TamA family outer membrane protein [Bacteroidetes bacterium]|nr:BamA/TamA family outer membrane protein [Bacteroidota bacterium]